MSEYSEDFNDRNNEIKTVHIMRYISANQPITFNQLEGDIFESHKILKHKIKILLQHDYIKRIKRGFFNYEILYKMSRRGNDFLNYLDTLK